MESGSTLVHSATSHSPKIVIWTRVKYLTGAQQAAFPSLDTLIWNDTCWRIIQEKNLTSATSAIMLAPLQLTCRGTWESKIYWDLSSATSQCNASCTCNNSLKRHAQTHIVTNDDKEEKPHKCTQCNYSANQANSPNKHILRHTGEKPHHCSHSGEKPHRCTTCEYFSIRYADLKRHKLK